MEHDGDGVTNCCWGTWDNPQRIGKRTGGLVNKKTSVNHPDYCIINIGQNTEKSPGDRRRLAVTQTPVRNYQLMVAWKILKGVNNNNNNNNNLPAYIYIYIYGFK